MSTSQISTISELFKFRPIAMIFLAVSATVDCLRRGLRSLTCDDRQLAVAPCAVRSHLRGAIRHGRVPCVELIFVQWLGRPEHSRNVFAWPAYQHLPNELRISSHCGYCPLEEQAEVSGLGVSLT